MRNGETTQSADFAALYHEAFERFGAQALWNKRRLQAPEPEDALVIARALRIEGDLHARRLAERIEKACRAVI
jgi:hypothetical protein